MLQVKVLTDVVTEPVTLAEAKAFMIIDADYTGDDNLITALLTAARQSIEKFTNLSLAPKVLQCLTDKRIIELPYGPVSSITEVTDTDGEIVSSDDYTVAGLDYKTIYLGYSGGESFYQRNRDMIDDEPLSTHTITYAAGYTSLPEALKLAIKEQTNHLYNTRGEGGPELSKTARLLAMSYSRNLSM